MTDNEKSSPTAMSDNEIIKALECCIQVSNFEDCKKCIYYGEIGCERICKENALDLLNRINAEIDKLTYQVNRLKKYDEERDIRLHARLTATAKAEAIKEFAERLKTEQSFYDGQETRIYLTEKDLDNLVKEMIGE